MAGLARVLSGLWRPEAGWARMLGGLRRPVAGCGGLGQFAWWAESEESCHAAASPMMAKIMGHPVSVIMEPFVNFI